MFSLLVPNKNYANLSRVIILCPVKYAKGFLALKNNLDLDKFRVVIIIII